MLGNENVLDCSSRIVTYTDNFKISAVKLYEQGLGGPEIFRRAGIDVKLIGMDEPRQCIHRWKRQAKAREKGEKKSSRGRPKKTKLTPEENIKRLEAEVEYLKAENDFLAKLRAKQSE